MDEPLWDWTTAAAVFLGVAAVLTLRADDSQGADADRAWQRRRVGLLLLTLSVGALMSRWVESVMTLPLMMRPHIGRQGTLTALCAFGIAAAVLSVTASTVAARFKSFLAVAASCLLALVVSAAWKWAALVWFALLAGGAGAAVVSMLFRARSMTLTRSASEGGRFTALRGESNRGSVLPRWRFGLVWCPNDSSSTAPREPALVLITVVGLLLLLLGTWQHVVTRESQRTTRSPRFSAWPRATALRDAWERTDWTAKADDDDSAQANSESAQRVAAVAEREQRIAWGLGALLLVVTGATWRRSSENEPCNSNANLSTEVEHVG